MISQIFFLSARGDTIINRDFRSDLIKNTPELFYRRVKLAKGDCEPVFNIEGINFAYIRVSSLYVVATTRFNVSPTFILELLHRIVVVVRDFCGVISEEMIRKNFVLIYEILGMHFYLLQTRPSISAILSSPAQLTSNLSLHLRWYNPNKVCWTLRSSDLFPSLLLKQSPPMLLQFQFLKTNPTNSSSTFTKSLTCCLMLQDT
jgi:hypothetical protein